MNGWALIAIVAGLATIIIWFWLDLKAKPECHEDDEYLERPRPSIEDEVRKTQT